MGHATKIKRYIPEPWTAGMGSVMLSSVFKDIFCCFAPFPSKSREKFFFMTYHTNLLNFVKKIMPQRNPLHEDPTPLSAQRSWHQFSISSHECHELLKAALTTAFWASQFNSTTESSDTHQELSDQPLCNRQVSSPSPNKIISPRKCHKGSVSVAPTHHSSASTNQGHFTAVPLAASQCWHCKHGGRVFALELLLLIGVLALLACLSWGAGEKASVFPLTIFGPWVNSQQLKPKSEPHFFHKHLMV